MVQVLGKWLIFISPNGLIIHQELINGWEAILAPYEGGISASPRGEERKQKQEKNKRERKRRKEKERKRRLGSLVLEAENSVLEDCKNYKG